MKNKLNVYLLLGPIISISLIFFSCEFRKENSVVRADVILYNLSVEVDLLEHWKKNYTQDIYFERKIKHLILNDIIALSNIKPEIKNLQGTPLETLYRIIMYNNSYELAIRNMETAFQPGIEYLNIVKDEVEQTLKERDEKRIRELKKNFQQK